MFLALFFFKIFVIYNKFAKFLKDLANISITLKINSQHSGINIKPTSKLVFTLPQSLYLPTEFSVGICTIILLIINLPTKLPTKMFRR
jgi:hypothetical protein